MTNQNEFIKNTFESGMWTDSYNSYQPQGTYRYARNAIHESDEYTSSAESGTFLTQEQKLREVVDLPGKPVGNGFVESREWVIYLIEGGEIGYVDLETYEYHTIYNGGCFDFDNCEYIEPQFVFRYGCNELLMYWSSGCVYYKMNIDEMLDPERSKNFCTNCGERTNCCSYFKLMKSTTLPNVVVERQEGGGNGALSGTYYFKLVQPVQAHCISR
jgi:hypothetical protein